jgi:hypothetical protein
MLYACEFRIQLSKREWICQRPCRQWPLITLPPARLRRRSAFPPGLRGGHLCKWPSAWPQAVALTNISPFPFWFNAILNLGRLSGPGASFDASGFRRIINARMYAGVRRGSCLTEMFGAARSVSLQTSVGMRD